MAVNVVNLWSGLLLLLIIEQCQCTDLDYKVMWEVKLLCSIEILQFLTGWLTHVDFMMAINDNFLSPR